MCNFSHIDLMGTKEEWKYLFKRVKQLSELFKIQYFDKVLNTLKKIVWYSFILNDESKKIEFFSNIYSCKRCNCCISGHPEFIVRGWISDFYVNYSEDIDEYPSHITKILMKRNLLVPDYICRAAGLIASTLHDDTMIPAYGEICFVTKDEVIYEALK